MSARQIALLTLVLFSVACHREQTPSSEIQAEAHQDEAAPAEQTVDEEPTSAKTPGSVCKNVGYEKAFTPSERQLVLNRKALKVHRKGEFVESARIWTEILDKAPDYDLIRFNRACSYAKLGRNEDALGELQEVFCRDLPSHFYRALSDQDLEPLREQIKALGDNVLADYHEAYKNRDPVVVRGSKEPNEIRSWAQAARYGQGRYVPTGPRVNRRSAMHEPPMIAASESNGSVVTVSLKAIAASDLHVGFPISLLWTELGTGQVLLEQEVNFAKVGLEIVVGSVENTEKQTLALRVRTDHGIKNLQGPPDYEYRYTIRGEPTKTTFPSKGVGPLGMTVPEGVNQYVRIGPDWVTVGQRPPEGFSIQGEKLVTPNKNIDLPRPHRQWASQIVVSDDRSTVVVVTSVPDRCDAEGRCVIDTIDLATGSSVQQRRAKHPALILPGVGTRLLMDHQEKTWIFENPRSPDDPVLIPDTGFSIDHQENNWGC